VAPFSLTDTSGNFINKSFDIRLDLSQIANDVTVQTGQVGDTIIRTDYLDGDGTKTNFNLPTNFSAIPTITVGGVTILVGYDGLDSDTNYDVMWNQTSQSIRFTAGHTPGSGTRNIVVTGTSRYPLIYRKTDQSSISTYGLRQKYIVDKTIQDAQGASLRASAEIASYSGPIISGNFRTYTSGLKVGQLITVDSTFWGLTMNFKIQNIRTTMRTPTAFEYEVQVESSTSIGINDILAKLLTQNTEGQTEITSNSFIERVSLFPEGMVISDAISQPTTKSGPYLWNDTKMKWNLFTWH
jgi:hypothetical protein